jgi:hypothetical protein
LIQIWGKEGKVVGDERGDRGDGVAREEGVGEYLKGDG